MKKIISKILLLFILLSYSSFYVLAQTEEERISKLKEEIQKLQEEADKYRQNIAQTQEEARTLTNEINSIQKQISNLENQIYLITKKIDKTALEINQTEGDIYEIENEISQQKNTIGELILSLDKIDKEGLLVILFKNPNLSGYFKQQEYTLKVNSNLLAAVSELKRNQELLSGHKTELENMQTGLEQLKYNQTGQKISLGGAKSDKDYLLKQTKGEESQYQKLLSEAEKKERDFFNELRALESQAISGGIYIVHEVATYIPPKGKKIFTWPEADKRITQGYGMTAYAKRGAYGGAPHNGLDVALGYGTPILAIGGGQIIANGTSDGWGNWAAIKHPEQGNLISLYSHMSAFAPLKVGTKINQGQVLGYEGATGKVTGPHLHLSLYKEFFTYINEKNGQLYFNYFDGTLNPLDYL